MSAFKVGDIVRYAAAWSTEEERKYLHIVREVGLLNPVKMTETRVRIETLNTGMTFAPQEVVDDFMIEPTGFNADELVKGDNG